MTRQGKYAGAARCDWPEVVELAQKILAANEAWKDGQIEPLPPPDEAVLDAQRE